MTRSTNIITSIGAARSRQRGVALALVLAVIGLAVVMGAAILASATVQAQVKSNATAAAQAQYLAESGISVGIYYLQWPGKAPLLANGFYPGQNGITFGSNVNGSANVSVTHVSGGIYDITSTASVDIGASNSITRQAQARVQVISEYQVNNAVSLTGSFTVPALMTITGNVRSDGVLTKGLGATISGAVVANGSNVSGWTAVPSYPTHAVPARDDLVLLASVGESIPKYRYTDSSGTHIGTPQVLPASVSGTPLSNASNPMGVWYADDDVTLGNCTISGTIVLRTPGKKLIIDGAAHVTAGSSMPAVIVPGAIQFKPSLNTKSLTVDGVCWTSGDIGTTSGPVINCTLQINGALMMAGTTPSISSDIVGTINVNYQATKVQVTDFSTTDCIPQSVKILRWGFSN